MKIRSYIKDKFVDFILWFLMILIIELFLIMFKVVNSLIIVVSITLIIFMIIIHSYDYYRKKEFYQDFNTKLKQLDKKCLISELIKHFLSNCFNLV